MRCDRFRWGKPPLNGSIRSPTTIIAARTRQGRGGAVMVEPKFKIGQSVYLRLKVSRSKEPSGKPYLVIRHLPTSSGKIRYRLRSVDNDERVASERELRPSPNSAGGRRTHGRFKVGQMVFYHPRATVIAAPISRPYQIAARLPSPDGEPQYRIRSPYEEHERAASESELRAV